MDRIVRLLCGAGLGAAAMYLFDPRQGRRRRALIRDQLVRLSREARDSVDVVSRDAANRAVGLWAETRAAFSARTPEDRTLAERVRSHLGRCVSHPRAISVAADDGAVTLGGPILAAEVDRLVSCVEGVPGVRRLVNRLDVHEKPGGRPSLQGGVTRTGA